MSFKAIHFVKCMTQYIHTFKEILSQITNSNTKKNWDLKTDANNILKTQSKELCPLILPTVQVIQEKYAEKFSKSMEKWELDANKRYKVNDIFSDQKINDLYANNQVPNFHEIALNYVKERIPENKIGISQNNAEFVVSISNHCK